MAKFIPQEILGKIQDSLDIVEVINEHVRLKKAGRSYKTLCPFHAEKTPSFIVSPEKQIYHCFGCGEGGNMFNFVMKYLNVDFSEAAENLARKAGVNIPSTHVPKRDTLKDKIYKINKLATKYYHQQLEKSKKTNSYLSKRGFNKKIIDNFLIGYAPDSWDCILNLMGKKGYSSDLIEKAGLILPKKCSGWYDRFRDRIIFPIFNVNSKVVGFGARTLGDNTPKYINSPETIVYSKRQHLYGLNFAKNSVRELDFVIVVEGYTDVLSLYQSGIKNVVSNLGTALTHQHIRKLKRYTDNVVMIYDSDEAGKIASLRNLDLLIENDMRIKLGCLPAGKDPDDYIKEFGKPQFLELVKNAKDLIDYKLHILNYKAKDIDIHKKKKIIEDILLTVGKVNDLILRNEYLNRLSDFSVTGIKEDTLRKKLQILLNKMSKDTKDFEVNLEISVDTDISSTEKLLLRAMLESEENLSKAKENINLDDLKHPTIRKVIETIFNLNCSFEDMSLERLMRYTKDSECSKLLASVFFEFENMPKHVEVLVDCIRDIELKKLDLQLATLKRKLKLADKKEERRLLFSYNNLRKSRENLKR